MNWMETLSYVLHYQLFEIEGLVFTPLQFLLSGLVLLITWLLARSLRRLLEQRILAQVQDAPRRTIARLMHHLIWAAGILLAFKFLHADLTAIAVVGGALGVGIGFGLQNSVANLVAGLILLFERPIKENDRVTVENIEGNVAEINFRSTTIITNDNIAMIVPNAEFINRTVVNWSYGDPKVRIHAAVSVAYGSDVELVTRTLLEIAASEEAVLADPEPLVLFKEFGDSSLNFELLVWTDQPARHFRLRSRLNYAIDAAFRRNGIEVPFPQRDVHIRSAAGMDGAFRQIKAS